MLISNQIKVSTFVLALFTIMAGIAISKSQSGSQTKVSEASDTMIDNTRILDQINDQVVSINNWFVEPDIQVDIRLEILNLNILGSKINSLDNKYVLSEIEAITADYLNFMEKEGRVNSEKSYAALNEHLSSATKRIFEINELNRNWAIAQTKETTAALHFSKSLINGLTFFYCLLILSVGFVLKNKFESTISDLKTFGDNLMAGKTNKEIEVTSKNEITYIKSSFNKIAQKAANLDIIEKQNNDLAKLNNTLKVKNDTLDNFIYRVSHDLKAPLTNIKSFINLLKGKLKGHHDPKVEITIDFLEKNSDKLFLTIHDLLEISRIEKSLSQKSGWINIAQILNSVKKDLFKEIVDSSTKIKTNFENVEDIYFGESNLKSILSNLITNSIKYRHEEKVNQIEISTQVVNNITQLVIKDNGIGIDLKKHQNKLFTIFSRFHNHQEGNGVGLYIVKKLIVEAGGNIEIDSSVDIGTTFTLSFPHKKEKTTLAISNK